VDNHDVTPRDLKKWIEEIVTNVKETAPLWQTAGWTIEGKEAVDFKKTVDAAEKKRNAVIEECGKAFTPLRDGKEVDAAKVKKAIEDIRQITRKTQEEMRNWKVPSSTAAKDMYTAYGAMLHVSEELLMKEFEEVLAIATNGNLTPEERMKKLTEVQERINAKEKPALEAYRTAKSKYEKHYDM
jgi:hypothetical protein